MDDTIGTFRLPGFARVSAMQDQPMMRVMLEFIGRQPGQALFNFERRFTFGKPGAI
jgi:hypothetical protein